MKESGQYCINCMKKKEGAGACPYCGFDAGGYMPRPHQLPPETIIPWAWSPETTGCPM